MSVSRRRALWIAAHAICYHALDRAGVSLEACEFVARGCAKYNKTHKKNLKLVDMVSQIYDMSVKEREDVARCFDALRPSMIDPPQAVLFDEDYKEDARRAYDFIFKS